MKDAWDAESSEEEPEPEKPETPQTPVKDQKSTPAKEVCMIFYFYDFATKKLLGEVQVWSIHTRISFYFIC